ncbi:hypothetical protein M378DRAFT_167210 [Amanita muscaria Koide BX008]|uniref:Uncharacterized protein n=1 Tax=Amanita muscaria (strain Koide BX008) TaxID=946122 RepID=A0A0C2WWN4_AMAMK|nr:hypothetical protein M378DRAFT_167210 [Amanita muscaria Koide BX008]
MVGKVCPIAVQRAQPLQALVLNYSPLIQPMSSVSKGKSKADPTGPCIRVEETPHEISREERPFRLKRKERLQNLSPIPPSHSRPASRGPFERGKSREFLPVLEATANPNIDRSVEVEVNRTPLPQIT